MKFPLALTLAFGAFAAVVGCGMQKEEPVFATVGSVKVLEGDLNLFLKEKNLNRLSSKYNTQMPGLLRDVAMVIEAEKAFPGILPLVEKSQKNMHTRLLTSAYQRFHVMERMFYSDEELEKFYNQNLANYQQGSNQLSYMDARERVASDYYIKQHQQDFKDFLASTGSDETDKMAKFRFVDRVKSEWQQTLGSSFVKKYKLEIAPPQGIDPKAVYEADPKQWMTSPGLYAYHIQMSDSLQLAKVAATIKTLEDFKKAAAESDNKELARRGGELGLVRKDHSLPYSLGIFPQLFEYYGESKVGLSAIIRASFAFHLFYVSEQVPAEQKSFERAKGLIEQKIASGAIAQDDATPLVLQDGKPVLFERDLKELYAEMPELDAKMYSRAKLASYMMEWYAFAAEALACGVDKSWEYKAVLNANRRAFIKQALIDSLNVVKESEIPENEKRYGYFYGKSVLDTTDYSKADFASYYPSVEKRAKEFKVRRFALNSELRNTLKMQSDSVHVNWAATKEISLARADSLNKAHKRDLARWEWSLLRALYIEDDSLFLQASVELAKLEVEAENFEEALKEYSVVAGMFPNNQEGEKALFNIGFILDENLNRKTDAAVVYRRFLSKYPKGELAESVSWLLKNIESEGKLAEDLIEKIEKAE